MTRIIGLLPHRYPDDDFTAPARFGMKFKMTTEQKTAAFLHIDKAEMTAAGGLATIETYPIIGDRQNYLPLPAHQFNGYPPGPRMPA